MKLVSFVDANFDILGFHCHHLFLYWGVEGTMKINEKQDAIASSEAIHPLVVLEAGSSGSAFNVSAAPLRPPFSL